MRIYRAMLPWWRMSMSEKELLLLLCLMNQPTNKTQHFLKAMRSSYRDVVLLGLGSNSLITLTVSFKTHSSFTGTPTPLPDTLRHVIGASSGVLAQARSRPSLRSWSPLPSRPGIRRRFWRWMTCLECTTSLLGSPTGPYSQGI